MALNVGIKAFWSQNILNFIQGRLNPHSLYLQSGGYNITETSTPEDHI